MSTNLVGATVNAGGTRIANAKSVGTNKLDTAQASLDHGAVVPNGNQLVPVKAAINMGILRRNSSGTLEELNPPTTPTRVG